MASDPSSVPEAVTGSIDTVLESERRAERDRSALSRMAHLLGGGVGSVAFALAHLGTFAVWLVLNSGVWPRLVFDAYPFALLGTVVSCEAVVLTTFVLIKQNRESERAERRSHLDLQVNLMTEREVTRMLQRVEQLCERAGLAKPDDPELKDMLEETALQSLADHVVDRHAGFRSET